MSGSTWKSFVREAKEMVNKAGVGPGICERCPVTKRCFNAWSREMGRTVYWGNDRLCHLRWEFPCGFVIEGRELPLVEASYEA
jgi:hypothetical protein